MTTANDFFMTLVKYLTWCESFGSGSESGRRGVAFAAALLGQRETIEVWASTYAEAQDRRAPDCIEGDYRDLLRAFFPFEVKYGGTPEVPDCGSIVCSLHSWLDTLGGHGGIRGYGH